MPKFTPHRSLLADAMAEIIEITALDQIPVPDAIASVVQRLEVKPYFMEPDARNGWAETWIVTAIFADGTRGVLGFTDGPLVQDMEAPLCRTAMESSGRTTA